MKTHVSTRPVGMTGTDIAKAILTSRGKVMVAMPVAVEHRFVPAEKSALIDQFRGIGDSIVPGTVTEVRDGTLYIIPGAIPKERPAPVPTKPERYRNKVNA